MRIITVCSDCGDELDIGLLLPEMSTDSTEETTLTLQINPCEKCTEDLLDEEKLDTKVNKPIQDKLKADNEQYVDILQPLLNYLRKYLRGGAQNYNSGSRVNYEVYRALLDEHPGVRKSIEACTHVRDIGIRPNMPAFLHYLAVQSLEEGSTKPGMFIEKLISGANLPVSSPIKIARDLLLSMKPNGRSKKRDVNLMIKYLINAWNLYVDDKEATEADIKGDPDDDMPQVKNCPLNP